MGLYSVKPKFQRTLDFVVAGCCHFGVHPDVFTYGAIIFSSLAFIAVFIGVRTNSMYFLLVIPLAYLRIMFNALDGLVARARNLADEAGNVKNEFGDRVSDMIILSALYFLPGINLYLATAILILTLLSSYLGIVGSTRIYAGFMAKADRMLYFSLFLAVAAFSSNYSLLFWFQVFMVAGLLQTIFIRYFILMKGGKK